MNNLQKELHELKAKVADLESRILFPNELVAKWQPNCKELQSFVAFHNSCEKWVGVQLT